jgi:hypothetical protein
MSDLRVVELPSDPIAALVKGGIATAKKAIKTVNHINPAFKDLLDIICPE